MYLAGKLGIFDKKGHSWKLLPVILPLLLAIFVGVTRIDDYWHHWTDVFAGALLGLSAAYFCYRQHFPSLYDEFGELILLSTTTLKHRAYTFFACD
jgi:diacylglycerol diphosphate phosphatase/phosphatidate phosphatase